MADGEAVLGEPRLAPFLRPPTVSFVTATEITEEEGDESWFAGISFSAESCGTGEIHRICSDSAKTPVSGCTVVTHRPYVLIASDKSGTFGWQVRDYQARAMRKLLACESKLIEGELWNAAVETTNTKIAGAGATTISGAGNPAPHMALKWIEQALADCGCGSRSMIHMRPKVFDSLLANKSGLLHREGNRWLTPMDNIVVPGRGYSGTGPAGQAVGATEWIYATPMIYLHRGTVRVLPDTIKQAMDRDTNDVTFYAERAVSTIWDTTCCHLALEVTP